MNILFDPLTVNSLRILSKIASETKSDSSSETNSDSSSETKNVFSTAGPATSFRQLVRRYIFDDPQDFAKSVLYSAPITAPLAFLGSQRLLQQLPTGGKALFPSVSSAYGPISSYIINRRLATDPTKPFGFPTRAALSVLPTLSAVAAGALLTSTIRHGIYDDVARYVGNMLSGSFLNSLGSRLGHKALEKVYPSAGSLAHTVAGQLGSLGGIYSARRLTDGVYNYFAGL